MVQPKSRRKRVGKLNKVVSKGGSGRDRGERTYRLRIVGGLHPSVPERATARGTLALLPGSIGWAGHPPALVLAVVVDGGDAGGAASAAREGRGDGDRLGDRGSGGLIRVVGGERGGDEGAEGRARAGLVVVAMGLLGCGGARGEASCAGAVKEDWGCAGRGDRAEAGGEGETRASWTAAGRGGWGREEGGGGCVLGAQAEVRVVASHEDGRLFSVVVVVVVVIVVIVVAGRRGGREDVGIVVIDGLGVAVIGKDALLLLDAVVGGRGGVGGGGRGDGCCVGSDPSAGAGVGDGEEGRGEGVESGGRGRGRLLWSTVVWHTQGGRRRP